MNKNIIIAILTIFLVIREYKHQQRIENLRSYYTQEIAEIHEIEENTCDYRISKILKNNQ